MEFCKPSLLARLGQVVLYLPLIELENTMYVLYLLRHSNQTEGSTS